MAEWVQKGSLRGPQGDPGQDAQLPAGGTEGQVLTKTSGGEAWADVPQPDIPLPVSQGGTGATTADGAAMMVFAHAPEASPTQAGVVKTLSDEDFCAYMGMEYDPADWS